MALPLIKWCGGKRKLAARIAELLLPNGNPLPEDARYYEPFLGGGAVFFHLVEAGKIKSHQAVLTDVNVDLINAYREVRDHVDGVINLLSVYADKHSEEFYYDARDSYNSYTVEYPGKYSKMTRAATFIYLNKTCFNGLYRVNKAGEFNVPYGKYANPTICDADGLRAASAALRGARIEKASFTQIFEMSASPDINPQDIIYADPPYVEIVKGGFTAYGKDGFGSKEQSHLACIGPHWVNGARIVLSNHDTPEVRQWYSKENIGRSRDYYTFETIQVARPINRDGAKRGKVAEVLIYGGGTP